MSVITKKIKLSTKGDTDIINITEKVREITDRSGLDNGSVAVFVPGATAGITTVEYEPGLVQDMKDFFEKISPKAAKYNHNTKWGDGNGYAHVRASCLGPGLTVPLIDKKLSLGTWQQIILIDFDNRARDREVIVQIIGE
ncbi:MAG: secondary thiamine-phosphate synthase enzyme YjbQ [Candidatus Omnitrophota bacterium]